MKTALRYVIQPERLSEARKRALLTQGQLAERASVSTWTIGQIETGVASSLRASTVRKLAGALGIPAGELADIVERDS